MEIRLLEIDAKMPVIPLMKAAHFHKAMGDNVEWFNPMFDLHKKIDKVYATKLFNFSEDYCYYPQGAEIIKGGTGFDIKSRLPEEIENTTNLDYSIYPQHNYSMQFFSRGCIRKCPFCVVREKEGYIHAVEPLQLNPRGKHIEVLDNNFFANPEWKQAVEQLLKWGQPVNMQGVDVRIMDEEQAYALNRLKHFKQIHIAWDNPKQDITENIKAMIKHVKAYKIMCYVLIGYWSTPEQDLYRIEKLRELKVDPFVMAFNKSDDYQRRFARWVNHKAVFKSVKWEDYK